jgi:hypothetical protein
VRSDSDSDFRSSSGRVGGGGGYVAPWEKSIEEAKNRIARAEAEAAAAAKRAAAAGQSSAWRMAPAKETIEVRRGKGRV